jgi:tRNA threonylcarbamoyladenosine biosynthesis protein TsaE
MQNMEETVIISWSPEETQQAASSLAATLERGAVLALSGELGAGKTCFVQGLADALQVEDVVSSPTFTLVNEYRADPPVYHIDLYRVSSEDEALDMGLDEYLFGQGVTAIEWSERIRGLLPADTIYIELAVGHSPTERRITIRQEYAAE